MPASSSRPRAGLVLVVGMSVLGWAFAAPAPAIAAAPLPADALEELGAAPSLVRALREPDDPGREYPFLVPVGDLDGDEVDDVVSIERGGATLTMVARRGVDGAVLFRTDTGITGASILVRGVRVGPAGDQGALLATYKFVTGAGGSPIFGSYGEHPSGLNNAGVEMELHLAAVASDGSVAWRRSFGGGQYVYTGTTLAVARDLPILVGALDAAPGPATDVAIAIYQRTPTADNSQDDSVRLLTIDGTSGEDAIDVELDIDNTEAPVRTAPDLDGDGSDDLLVPLLPAAGETVVESPTLLALSGGDGAELWRTAPAGFGRTTSITPLDDVTGDGGSEIAIGSRTLRSKSSPQTPILILDGASGAPLPTPPADTARPLGDVDDDGVAEILLSSATYTSTAAGVVHRAVRGGGEIAWERSDSLAGASSVSASLLIAPGDVDGDGFPDLAHRLVVQDGVEVGEERVVSGRTGAAIAARPSLGSPLGTSLDGEGDDFYRVLRFGDSVIDVAAADGVTGDELFRARLRPRGDLTRATSVGAADLTGDGVPDLVVNTDGELPPEVEVPGLSSGVRRARDGYVIDGSSGDVVWATDPSRLPDEPDQSGIAAPGAPFTWDGTVATGLNTEYFTDERCSPDEPRIRCEHVLVEMAAPPPEGSGTSTSTATIRLDQFGPVPEPATDFDLIVYESDELGTRGPFVDDSTSGLNTTPSGETVTFEIETTQAQPSRYYLVRVVYYTSVESGYRGTATMS